MRKQKKTLIEVYPDWRHDGIFSQLSNFNVVWKDDITARLLDLNYYGNRSGGKEISIMLYRVLEDEILTQEAQTDIATLIFQKYNTAWRKAYEALNTEYKPLDNYAGHEEEVITNTRTDTKNGTESRTEANTGTITKEGTNTGTKTNKKTGTDTTTDNYSETQNGTNSNNGNTNNKIFGFDSLAGSNKDSSTTSDTETTQQTQTHEGNGSTVYNSQDQETLDLANGETTTNNLNTQENKQNDETNESEGETRRVLDRGGNMGVTSSQQMLNEELEVRFNWKFFDLVFEDVDRELTQNTMEVY